MESATLGLEDRGLKIDACGENGQFAMHDDEEDFGWRVS